MPAKPFEARSRRDAIPTTAHTMLMLGTALLMLTGAISAASAQDVPDETASPPSTGEGETPDKKVERMYRKLKEAHESDEAAHTEEAPPLTPEQEFERTFQVQQRSQEEAARRRHQQENTHERSTFFIVSPDQASPPRLEWGAQTECFYGGDDTPALHAQCDHAQKSCLIAETHVVREEPPTGESGASPLSNRSAARQDVCLRSYPLEALELLRDQDYTLTPALLATPYGYKRDERGRIFQRFFDLKSRALLGVGYAGLRRDATPYTGSLRVETRSSYEHLSVREARRHRYRFLEGSLMLEPVRVEAMLFNYERGRAGKEPIFYITELIGEPTRHDVYLDIGYGVTFLRYDRRALGRALERSPSDNAEIEMPTTQSLLDIMHVYLQWELAQDVSLEDFFALRVGGGVGTRARGEDALYVYPELGFVANLLKSPRGLFALNTEGKMRYIVEPSTNTRLIAADVRASAEWVFLTISDQPISLYLEPRIDWMSYRHGTTPLEEFRITSGLRFSLFTPAPKHPALHGKGLAQ